MSQSNTGGQKENKDQIKRLDEPFVCYYCRELVTSKHNLRNCALNTRKEMQKRGDPPRDKH